MTKSQNILKVGVRAVKHEPAIITPNARTDCREFFAKSDVLSERRPHHHFLVFVKSKHSVTVRMVDAARKLDAFEDDCVVLVQWPGQWRSDWFRTTVGAILSARQSEDEGA